MARHLNDTVLLTGGRMPASLAMARVLKKAGAVVIGSDAIDTTPLCRSNSVDSYIKTPSPSKEPRAFLEHLSQIVLQCKVTHLIPMYEEAYVVSAGLDILNRDHPDLTIFVDSVETLSILDDKSRFIAHCESLGLRVPRTKIVTSVSGMNDVLSTFSSGNIVIKPVFSRFAQGVFIDPGPAEVSTIIPTEQTPWVVQQRIVGPVASSYGVCRAGQVLVHGDYGNDFVVGSKSKQGLGASSSYQPMVLPGSREFADILFGSLNYTGQYGLDYIIGDDGIYCIECNPRATSGVHLFERDKVFGSLMLGLAQPREPRSSGSANHLQLLQCIFSNEASVLDPKLIRAFLSRDVLFSVRDPMPVLAFRDMVRAMAQTARLQKRPVTDVFFEDLACEPRLD